VTKLTPATGYKVDAVAFFPDGIHIAGNIENSGARVWNIQTGSIVATLATFANRPDALAVSPDGTRLLVAPSDGIAEWVKPTSPKNRGRDADQKHRIAHHDPVRIGFSPAGTYFCIAEWHMHLFHSKDLKTFRQYRDPTGRPSDDGFPQGASVNAFAFKPDDSRLALALGHHAVVWSPDDFEAGPVKIAGHGRMVKGIGFLPDGNLLTAGMDGTVRVWNPDTGVELQSFDWGVGKVQCAAVSPDGTLCAAGSDDGRIVVWDVDS